MNPSHKSANLPAVPNTTNGLHSTIADLMEIPASQVTPQRNPNIFDESLSMDELLAMPPRKWIVDSIIGRGDLAMIYGGSGCGKTFVAIDLIGSLCTGQQFAGRFDVSEPLTVAYCAGEGVSGLPARFKAMMNRRSIDGIENFYFWKQTPQLCDKAGTTALNISRFVESYQHAQAIGRAPLDVLFIDTLHSSISGADENSSGDMGVVVESCREAIRALNCAVILIHHTGKSGESERGSSALRGAMDAMLLIRRISDVDTKAVMQCTKLKDGEQWKQQTFDLVANGDSVAVWWDDPADDVATGKGNGDREAIIKLLGDGYALTGKAIGQGIGMGESKQIYKLLERLEADNKITKRLQDESRRDSSRNPWVYEIVK